MMENSDNNEDPMLNFKAFFMLRNNDPVDTISAVSAGDIHIVRDSIGI